MPRRTAVGASCGGGRQANEVPGPGDAQDSAGGSFVARGLYTFWSDRFRNSFAGIRRHAFRECNLCVSVSFALSELTHFSPNRPTTCAVGCILSVLRGPPLNSTWMRKMTLHAGADSRFLLGARAPRRNNKSLGSWQGSTSLCFGGTGEAPVATRFAISSLKPSRLSRRDQ